MKMLRTITCVGLLALALTSCDDAGSGGVVDSFDRQQMITDVADRIIIPSYQALEAELAVLKVTSDAFVQNPTPETLAACQAAWNQASLAWQRAQPWDFGPAEGAFGNLSLNVGTFPASGQKIEDAIARGDASLADFNRDARGLYGAEYLLFSGSKDEITGAFTDPNGGNRCDYLKAVINRLISEVQDVREQWTTGYRDRFIAMSGTDAGSGASLLFNNMNISYEVGKNYKLGLPLGRMAGQNGTEPEKVEALFSGQSIRNLRAHFDVIRDLWEGRDLQGQTILGFRDYLKTVSNGQRLIDDTEVQLVRCQGAFDALRDDELMSDLILNDSSRLETLHTEMQKLTRFYKSELSSLLGISITYSSGDGD